MEQKRESHSNFDCNEIFAYAPSFNQIPLKEGILEISEQKTTPSSSGNRCPEPNQNCVKYLAASYLYYEKNFSPMSDHEFDMLCMDLYDQFNQVTHWAKSLINQDSLLAGTGFQLFGRTPGAIIGIAELWKQDIESGLVNHGRYPKRADQEI